MRTIHSEYQDPLDAIWLRTCRCWGWNVERSDQVFASWNGQGTLTIGSQNTLDPDDSLAQLILHEFCHAMVEGKAAWEKSDWGLDITDSTQLNHEHAALILQACLSDPWGLRTFFGSTTDARKFYDRLPETAVGLKQHIEDSIDQPNTPPSPWPMAKRGLEIARRAEFWAPLQTALSATQAIAQVARPFLNDTSLWSTVSLPPEGRSVSKANSSVHSGSVKAAQSENVSPTSGVADGVSF